MSPLIPYLELPELPILSAKFFFGRFPAEDVTLKPFGMLVALGAYAGTVASLRQARRLGASERAILSLTGWVAVFALVFAHWLDALLYFPHDVLADPYEQTNVAADPANAAVLDVLETRLDSLLLE